MLRSHFRSIKWLLAGGVWLLGAQTSRTVVDGVYSDAQAKRGAALYGTQCAACHGNDLTGGDETPPLAGGEFLDKWRGLPVDTLFERVKTTMPADKPGRLSRQQNADVLAYILQFNKYPAGQAELSTQTGDLKQIMIEPPKQQ